MPAFAGAKRRPFPAPKLVLELGLFGPFPSQTGPVQGVVLQHPAPALRHFARVAPVRVCDDLAALVQELAEEQESWLLRAPSHVRKVYHRGRRRCHCTC